MKYQETTYPPGTQRVVYLAKEMHTGLSVTARVLSCNSILKWLPSVSFTEYGGGVYSTKYDFPQVGGRLIWFISEGDEQTLVARINTPFPILVKHHVD
jgi:hypothetical protein